jgi:tetratricopeptide (TPR) repeat protein
MRIRQEAEGYLELGLPVRALEALDRLGDPAAFGGHALYLQGEALRTMQRYREALVPLTRAAEATPDNLQVCIALGWCYKRTGQIHKAIRCLEKALDGSPTEALLHYNLACYWSLAGNKHRAMEYLSRALRLAPACHHLIDDEPDFDPIRSDGKFQALCRAARKRC